MKTSEWRSAFTLLTARGVKGVSAQEALNLSRWPRSHALIDVRRDDQFEKYRVKGSRSAPLYRLIQGSTPLQLLRSLAFQAQGVNPVEGNPEFLSACAAAAAGASGIVFLDAEGGSLVKTATRPTGQVCRALAAAYTLLSNGGFKGSVYFLEGGLNDAFDSGLFTGEGAAPEWQRSSRTPNSGAR